MAAAGIDIPRTPSTDRKGLPRNHLCRLGHILEAVRHPGRMRVHRLHGRHDPLDHDRSGPLPRTLFWPKFGLTLYLALPPPVGS